MTLEIWIVDCVEQNKKKNDAHICFFSEERMRNGVKKLAKARTGSTQGRLDGFFKVLSSPSNSTKRKVNRV